MQHIAKDTYIRIGNEGGEPSLCGLMFPSRELYAPTPYAVDELQKKPELEGCPVCLMVAVMLGYGVYGVE